MNVSILGMTGAGKGTQTARLAHHFDLLGFSPGERLREEVKNRTTLGLAVRGHVERGESASDQLVNSMVEDWLKESPASQGVVFDGFPRTVQQTQFLEGQFEKTGRSLNAVIYLDVSYEVIAQRLTGRRVCAICHERFNLLSSPFTSCPQTRCNGDHMQKLQQDHPEVIFSLVHGFQRSMQSFLDYLKDKGQLITVSANGPTEEVHSRILSELAQLG